MSPPKNVDMYDDFNIPKPGVLRVEDKVYQYVMPGPLPNTCDIIVVADVGLPAPQWMIPMSLLSKFLSYYVSKTFIKLKQNVVDTFEHGVPAGATDSGNMRTLSSASAVITLIERMRSNKVFYDAVAELNQSSSFSL